MTIASLSPNDPQRSLEIEALSKRVAIIVFGEKPRGLRDEAVKAREVAPGRLRFDISQMYEFADVSFGALKQVSELLGTEHIDIGHGAAHGGCSSCDHGSEYIVELTAWI